MGPGEGDVHFGMFDNSIIKVFKKSKTFYALHFLAEVNGKDFCFVIVLKGKMF